jgi:pilus assembly protein Flp/PilA
VVAFFIILRMCAMNRESERRGQGLVEYALVLMLVAIVVIIVVALLGPAIGNMFSNVVSNI